MVPKSIRLLHVGLVTVLAVSAVAAQAGDGAQRTWRDDFSTRAAGSDAAPAWDPQTVGWEVHDGGYVGDSGTSVWHAVPLGAAVTLGLRRHRAGATPRRLAYRRYRAGHRRAQLLGGKPRGCP